MRWHYVEKCEMILIEIHYIVWSQYHIHGHCYVYAVHAVNKVNKFKSEFTNEKRVEFWRVTQYKRMALTRICCCQNGNRSKFATTKTTIAKYFTYTITNINNSVRSAHTRYIMHRWEFIITFVPDTFRGTYARHNCVLWTFYGLNVSIIAYVYNTTYNIRYT